MNEQGPRLTSKEGSRRTTNRGNNLSREDRARGGERSARLQERDARGHFAGRKPLDDAGRAARAARSAGDR
jgi:hypothetical protein